MTNTVLNSKNIQVFSDNAYEKIVGKPSNSYNITDDGFLNLFGSNESTQTPSNPIDSELLPTTSCVDVGKAAEAFLTRNGVMASINNLLSIKLPKNYDQLISNLINQAQPGKWTSIDFSGNVSYHSTINSDESGLVFDVETFVKASPEIGSPMPIVAQAISHKALWMWLHPSWDGQTPYYNTFVSVGEGKTLVGHNIGYDLARITERFSFNKKVFGIDTMSMVNAVHGLDSSSRMALMSKNTNFRLSRQGLGCMKSLVAAYNHVVEDKLKPADKKARNIFVEAETFQEFIDNKCQLLTYSMLDVVYTLELFQKLYIEFIDWSNGYSVLVGIIMATDALLPVQPDREEWITKCEDLVEKNKFEIYNILLPFAEEIERTIDCYPEEAYPELHKLDWRRHKPKGWRKKTLPEGWPNRSRWFHSFLVGEFKLTGLDFPRLLQLRYDGHKLQHHRSMGWFYIKNGTKTKLPHKSGNEKDNVGNPMSSDSLRWVEDGEPLLTSDLVDDATLYEILRLLDANTTFNGFSDRIKSKIVYANK